MVAVIGDIHGCFYTLQSLVEKIKQKYPAIPIYSVGDLVDRGNYSYEVLEYIISEKIPFTPGNHDYMFYAYIKEPETDMARAWLQNGAETTLRSYENHSDKINDHLEYIKKAPLYFNTADCFISHAGISSFYSNLFPQNLLDHLAELDFVIDKNLYSMHSIIWTREELLNIGKLQVVGHTRRLSVFNDKENQVLYIDTAAVANNKLTAVIVNHNSFIDIVSEGTNISDTSEINY